MVVFNSRPVAAKLLRPKSLANVLHYVHTSRLKQNFKSADPTGNRTWRISVKTLAIKRYSNCIVVVLHAKGSRKGKFSSGERFENAFVNAGRNMYFCFISFYFLFYLMCI